MPDPYSVLGVHRTADADTIRKAYKKLARKFHPDVSKAPDAEARFKEVNAAYDVVGDAEKRKLYDRYGDVSTRPGFDPRRARRGGFDFGAGVDVDDLLGGLYGGGFSSRPRRGSDQQVQLSIPLLDAVRGAEREISVRRPDGTLDRLKVPVPAGARDGGRVRLKGQGLPPRGGGPCGDLVVRLQIQPHPVLRRVENDLEMDVPITILEAIEGASITVPTPTGDVKLRVPPGTVGGARLRIRGRGIQKRSGKGDLYLILRPVAPASTDDAILEAARTLEEAYDGPVREGLVI